LIALTGFGPKDKPTVYVVADSGESVSRNKAKKLSDSAEDLRQQVKKRRDIVLAADPVGADIIVTILDRRIEIEQNRQTYYGGGHTQNQYQSRHIITYRIQVGESSREAEYFVAGSLVTWRRVSSGLSKQIERWARDNTDELLERRAQ
jgi:hypothetical protein